MKKNIHSRVQLKAEIERLTLEKKVKEQHLNQTIRDYSTSLKPINLIKNAFGSLKNDTDVKGMLKTKGIEAAIGFFVTQMAFKNSNPIIRTAATSLGTSFASGVFGDDSVKYVEKFKKLFQKFRTKIGRGTPGSFNEEDIYTG